MQAEAALTNAGCTVTHREHDWGLGSTPSGHTYLTVQSDDIDTTSAAAEALDWRIRSIWASDEDIEISDGGVNLTKEERLSRVEADLAILKGDS